MFADMRFVHAPHDKVQMFIVANVNHTGPQQMSNRSGGFDASPGSAQQAD
jgi:hypothetical protein